MFVAIRQIGNSLGVAIPKPLLIEAGLSRETGAEMTLEGDVITIRRPMQPQRTGWAEACAAIAAAGDDRLLKGCARNEDSESFPW